MDQTYLFCGMLAFTIIVVVAAIVIADRLDKKSSVNS